MTTKRTQVIAVRVPVEVRDALIAEAAVVNHAPGEWLRALLEGRFKPQKTAGPSNDPANSPQPSGG